MVLFNLYYHRVINLLYVLSLYNSMKNQ